MLWGRGPIGHPPHLPGRASSLIADLLELAPPLESCDPRWLPGLHWASPSTPLDVALMLGEAYQAWRGRLQAGLTVNLRSTMTPLHDQMTSPSDAEPSETTAATGQPACRARRSA